jgi:hypothetical protein
MSLSWVSLSRASKKILDNKTEKFIPGQIKTMQKRVRFQLHETSGAEENFSWIMAALVAVVFYRLFMAPFFGDS